MEFGLSFVWRALGADKSRTGQFFVCTSWCVLQVITSVASDDLSDDCARRAEPIASPGVLVLADLSRHYFGRLQGWPGRWIRCIDIDTAHRICEISDQRSAWAKYSRHHPTQTRCRILLPVLRHHVFPVLFRCLRHAEVDRVSPPSPKPPNQTRRPIVGSVPFPGTLYAWHTSGRSHWRRSLWRSRRPFLRRRRISSSNWLRTLLVLFLVRGRTLEYLAHR